MSDPFADARLSSPGYKGSIEREKPLLELAAREPYEATVTVTRMQFNGYADKQFEVIAKWVGPPMVQHTELPPPRGPVHAQDQLLLGSFEEARRVAELARDALAAGQTPDLWLLAGRRR